MSRNARTIADQLSLKRLSEHEFESIYLPEKMGNTADIAYGGCALGAAAQAAQLSLPSAPNSPYHLYSMCGYYLGPALTDRPLKCSVKQVRSTRTFQTFYVEAGQDLGDKGYRVVLTVFADFQIEEPASLLEYSAPPRMKYKGPEDLLDWFPLAQKLADRGVVSQALVDHIKVQFGFSGRFFESRPCEEGIFAQNLNGIAKHVVTTQEHLPITDRTTADFFRSRHRLGSQADHVSALCFVLDAAVAFMPLSIDHKFVDDVGACSTLDFAIRIFSNNVDLNSFHLREMNTVAASAGRTYSEARVWDMEGNMVASVTQQSICRPKPSPNASL